MLCLVHDLSSARVPAPHRPITKSVPPSQFGGAFYFGALLYSDSDGYALQAALRNDNRYVAARRNA
jgi:hypothetical protein